MANAREVAGEVSAPVIGQTSSHRSHRNPWVTLGLWDAYFFAKFFLFFGNFIGFHFFANLAFAIFVAFPLQHKRWARLRQFVSVPAAISLFYYDTWLPPISRLWSHADDIGGFDAAYLLEIAGRFVNPWVIAGLVLLCAAYFFLRSRLRMTTFVIMGMLATQTPWLGLQSSNGTADFLASFKAQTGSTSNPVALQDLPPKDSDLSQILESFYAAEAQRSVAFTAPKAGDPPFDILVLQICSLSWDDLDFVKERENPLFAQFDLIFSNFNSATSYSGPAVLRLLRSSVGQQRHASLYERSDRAAQTFENLKQIGYETQWAMNHNGRYGNFLSEIRERGGLMSNAFVSKVASPYLVSFDGSSVQDDYALLSTWFEQRKMNPAQRVAFFYNTISLHDGNGVGGPNRNSLETYRPRLRKLLSDISKFIALVNASDRKAVVVFIPEHGASIRGDKVQIAGMRDYPSFSIGHVPVGVKFIGKPHQLQTPPYSVTNPSSYQAVSKLLADSISHNPFVDGQLDLSQMERNLPVTGFVAENSGTVVMRYGKRYYMQTEGASWVEY